MDKLQVEQYNLEATANLVHIIHTYFMVKFDHKVLPHNHCKWPTGLTFRLETLYMCLIHEAVKVIIYCAAIYN